MKELKKLDLSLTQSKELGEAFDSLKLSDTELQNFVGGCLCSIGCTIHPCEGSWKNFGGH